MLSSVQIYSTFKSTLPWNQLRKVCLAGLFAALRGDYSKQMGLGQFVGASAVLVGLGVSLSEDKAASTRGPFLTNSTLVTSRAARIVRLPRSLLDPESFPHTAYVKILATLARKTVN